MTPETQKSSVCRLFLEVLWNFVCFRVFLVEIGVAGALVAAGLTGHVALGASSLVIALIAVYIGGCVGSCLRFRADGIPMLDALHLQVGSFYAGLAVIGLAPLHFVLTGLLLTSVIIAALSAVITFAIAAYLGSKVGV